MREYLYQEGVSEYTPKEIPVTVKTPEGVRENKRAQAYEVLDVNSGDLNSVAPSFNSSKRSLAIINLRDTRDFSFPYLIDQPRVKQLKDSELVTAVLQGDWRALKGSEINVFDEKQMNEFADMAEKYQKKLDALREQYKDAAPKRLYHGSREFAEPTVRDVTGFNDPQAMGTVGQTELNLKAVSFTSDPTMNIKDTRFGGKNPERYIYTEMPRAEYEFKRVNMTPDEYNNSNMNVIAQTLNGSNNVIRPLSLPRSMYKETEDTLIEVDKFKPGASQGAGEKLYHGREKMSALIKGNLEQTRLERDTIGTINFLRERATGATEAEKGRIAYALYGQIKDLLNIYLKQAGGPDTRGLGQSYMGSLERMANEVDDPHLTSYLTKYFKESGSKQKVANLKQLSEALHELRMSTGAGASDMKPKIKAVNDIRELTKNFKKGGLASKK